MQIRQGDVLSACIPIPSELLRLAPGQNWLIFLRQDRTLLHILQPSPRWLLAGADIDWGDLSQLQDQFFITRTGTEHFVLCPTNIPLLQEYYAALPYASAQPQHVAGRKRDLSASADGFATLPPELQYMLMAELPLRDVLALRHASATMRDLELTQTFWKGRITRDLPWHYDIPCEAWANSCIDWHAVYKRLYAGSQLGHEESVLALCNRRRIWTTTDQIMDTYFTELSRVRFINTKPRPLSMRKPDTCVFSVKPGLTSFNWQTSNAHLWHFSRTSVTSTMQTLGSGSFGTRAKV